MFLHRPALNCCGNISYSVLKICDIRFIRVQIEKKRDNEFI